MAKYPKSKLVDFTHKQYSDIRRVSKKLRISSNEVIRRRIKPFEEMVQELEEDLKLTDSVELDRF